MTNCVSCGRFVSYASMEDGTAHFYFEPDNHFGPERSEWTCARCVETFAADHSWGNEQPAASTSPGQGNEFNQGVV